jgi:steroid delta-isomerase-like uncharacterized protein
MMVSTEVPGSVERYFQAWNDRDPAAVVAAFDGDGTYTDPSVSGPPLSGERLAAHATALFTGFPDLRFEIVGADASPGGRVVARWLLRGTNTGPLWGLPPSGRAVAMPGIDFIELGQEGLRRVEGQFDRQTMAEQLGLQVIVQPVAAGPFRFGSAVRADRADAGGREVPGAISLTWIDVRSEDEAQEVREISRPLAAAMTKMPGFISWIGVVIAGRLMTITAWESEAAARQIMRQELHREGVRRFFAEDLGVAVHTGVWTVGHLNPLWVRCSSCGRPGDPSRSGGVCACGSRLPQSPVSL